MLARGLFYCSFGYLLSGDAFTTIVDTCWITEWLGTERLILIVGAHSVLRRARQLPEKYSWLTQLLARRPFKVIAVALANKMARIAWALLARGGVYRAPQLVAA
jgi:hypothetical protein